ncbi:hypothetical protein D915_007775 [Fasciola hepatica]|uniref:Uncharacterized protein n=1 Tax=Fasciola hepatica TaxID=6192 RepID=A0A4E0RYJ2_FASHE|nr:hypothetical protein D915_007775 [Fasciola hepatica]
MAVDSEKVNENESLTEEETSSKSSSLSKISENSDKRKAYIGFGYDLNYLFWVNSWICMTYFVTGLSTFVLHICTYRTADGTLQLECYGSRCWTAVREARPGGHNYNLLKHHGQYYQQQHTGLWFGFFLMLYGILAAFRFTRCVINLGYFSNVIVILLCVIVAPINAAEYATWLPGLRPKHERAPHCNWLKIRIVNDLVLVLLTFTTAIFQLIINTPYVKHRSIRLLEPLLKAIKNDKQIPAGWITRQSPYHNIRL